MDSPNQFDQEQKAHWNVRTNLRSYTHPVVRAFAAQRIAYLRGLLAGWRPAHTLEVGCGDGFGMTNMPALADDIHGCDISWAMLQANPCERNRLARADACALPYQDASFDLVYCWELLHHVGEPQKAVNEMRRVSRKGVLLCEPNCLNLPMAAFGIVAREERGLLRFTPGYTKRLLINAGLRDVRVASVGCFPPNRTPPWMVGFFQKLPYRWPIVGMYNIAIGYL